MKKIRYNYISAKAIGLLVLLLTFLGSFNAYPQEEDEKKKERKPVRAPFESAHLIDNQTVIVPSKNTLEFDIQHRFGTLENGSSDFWGMWASSNIRLGLSYTVIENLSIGVGATKFNKFTDFNLKWNFLKQTRDWSIPVGITYYGYVALDTRDEEKYENGIQKLSYFNELIIASRISRKLSLQIIPSISHFNAVDSLYSNDVIAVTFNGRYKVSSQSSILFEYDYQITNHDIGNEIDRVIPSPGLGLGFEVSTSSHAFQIFISNFQDIMYHKNLAYNDNDIADGWEAMLIGFNITRLWGL